MLKNLPANVGDARDVVSIPVLGRSPGSSGRNILEYLRETSCSSILAWAIPWTEESGGLQSTGLQRDTHS